MFRNSLGECSFHRAHNRHSQVQSPWSRKQSSLFCSLPELDKLGGHWLGTKESPDLEETCQRHRAQLGWQGFWKLSEKPAGSRLCTKALGFGCQTAWSCQTNPLSSPLITKDFQMHPCQIFWVPLPDILLIHRCVPFMHFTLIWWCSPDLGVAKETQVSKIAGPTSKDKPDLCDGCWERKAESLLQSSLEFTCGMIPSVPRKGLSNLPRKCSTDWLRYHYKKIYWTKVPPLQFLNMGSALSEGSVISKMICV